MYLHSCLLHSPWSAEIHVDGCARACSAVLANTTFFPRQWIEEQEGQLKWLSHFCQKDEIGGWWKVEEAVRVKMKERRTAQQLKMDRQRVAEKKRGERAFEKRWQSWGDFPEPGLGARPTALWLMYEGCQGHSASNLWTAALPNAVIKGLWLQYSGDHIAKERGLWSKSIHLDRCLCCNETVGVDS